MAFWNRRRKKRKQEQEQVDSHSGMNADIEKEWNRILHDGDLPPEENNEMKFAPLTRESLEIHNENEESNSDFVRDNIEPVGPREYNAGYQINEYDERDDSLRVVDEGRIGFMANYDSPNNPIDEPENMNEVIPESLEEDFNSSELEPSITSSIYHEYVSLPGNPESFDYVMAIVMSAEALDEWFTKIDNLAKDIAEEFQDIKQQGGPKEDLRSLAVGAKRVQEHFKVSRGLQRYNIQLLEVLFEGATQESCPVYMSAIERYKNSIA